MLQISQTENPICSATIDQMRLRRAMALPLVFQNVSSSGFQSEIQVGFGELIEISFLNKRGIGFLEITRKHDGARRGPSSGGVTNRVIGFGGRRRWRQHQLFKLCA